MNPMERMDAALVSAARYIGAVLLLAALIFSERTRQSVRDALKSVDDAVGVPDSQLPQ